MKHPSPGNNNQKALNELFTRRQADDQQLLINIPRGSTCREARDIVAYEMQQFLNLVDKKLPEKPLKQHNFLHKKTNLLYHSKKR